MNNNCEWEPLCAEEGSSYTSRLKVFGGWLIIVRDIGDNETSIASSFVPDPNHEWSID